ncbi:DUF1800 domain-containing protein [Brevibacillus parabrevis]|uniref:DUF1800 domain-containing protein n=1 Tax=Brevibacillus parabrevis TaxID=54914 RepID=UPI002E200126|nr:DUF1800 domain-containing protein [Brevibacillus parabrevis]
MDENVKRLYDKAGFGSYTGGAGLQAAIKQLVTADPAPRSFESLTSHLDHTKDESNGGKQAFRKQEREALISLQHSWLRAMVTTKYPLQERMTLFWHNHFATGFAKVKRANLMARQNDLLYRHALGKLGPLLQAISKDAAMLIWLDGDDNTLKAPNENYAREVMELFTLGVGHYAEHDIKEAARALTGWKVDKASGRVQFRSRLHDTGSKTIFQQTAAYDLDSFVELLLAHPRTAVFVTAKVLRAFYKPAPSADEIEYFARIYRQSDYDMAALLSSLMRYDAFVADLPNRTLVRSPAEWMASTLRATDVAMKPQAASSFLKDSGQVLFDPPTVAGWEGGEAWLSTTTLLARFRFAQVIGQNAKHPDGLSGSDLYTYWRDKLNLKLGRTSEAAILPYTKPKKPSPKQAASILALMIISPEYQKG